MSKWNQHLVWTLEVVFGTPGWSWQPLLSNPSLPSIHGPQQVIFNGLELNISLLLPKFFTASDSAEQESETFWTAYRQISLVTGSDLCDTASIYSVHFLVFICEVAWFLWVVGKRRCSIELNNIICRGSLLKLVQIPLKYRPKKLSVLTLRCAVGETTRNAKNIPHENQLQLDT